MAVKYLALGTGMGPGPFLASWPRDLFFLIVLAALVGGVAMWNRSRP
jgi:hypothetical protein